MRNAAFRKLRLISQASLALFLILLPLQLVVAQGGVGTLTGVVRDPNGANLAGVTVEVKNLATGATRTVSTDDQGHWSMPGLAAGSYQVTYEITGFKKQIREKVDVEASVPRSLDDKLEIGEVGATINITDGASLITPDTSTTFRQLTAEQLVAVPTSTRSFTQLLSTEAGVNTELSPVLTNGN